MTSSRSLRSFALVVFSIGLAVGAGCSGSAKESGGNAAPGGAGAGAAAKKPAGGAAKGPASQPPARTAAASKLPDWSFLAADVDARRFARDCGAGLEQAKEMLPPLLATPGARTEATVLVPFNQILAALERSGAVASLMRTVHPVEGVRKAAEECEQNVALFVSELSRSRELYELIKAVDVAQLDPAAARLHARLLRDLRREGVDKDEKTRARLQAIDKELVDLGQEFTRKVDADVRTIKLKSVKDLAGLPEDYVKEHTPAVAGKPIEITTNYPDYSPFMSYADSVKYRKQLYVTNRQRGGEENDKVLRKILELRREKAKLLGYDNFADYVTEDKMMKNSANVAQFLDRLQRVSAKKARKEYEDLLAYKREHIDAKAKRVEDYEKVYIENKVKAKTYSFDAQAVRPYFPYRQTEDGLLAITGRMYGVEYRPATGATVWHPDVRALEVVRGGELLGRIYLDMHPREGKYTHAAQFTLISGVVGQQIPEGVLVCNFPKPADGSPGLMEHEDVVTMFHEFGHLMHHVLGGKQKWIPFSGTTTEWDFVEAPSQMFEEWASRYESLSTFARHYESGETIPKELVDNLRKSQKFGIGLTTAQQTFYSAISLNFHTADPKKLDMNAEVRRLQDKYTPFRFVEGTRFQASFGHLEGYSAFYYTYMWSLVIAKDLFSPFEQHGLMDPETNTRYRDRVLTPGGSMDAVDLIKGFLGREFSYEAFERDLSQ